MTNILTEKVKQLDGDLKDIVYKLTGGRIDGTEQLFIALLEADVERLLQQKNEILLKAPLPDSERFALKEIRREVTYKQQAIDELKKSI